MVHDYSGFTDSAINNDKLAQLGRMALEQQECETEVTRLETELKLAQKALAAIAEQSIPTLMDEAGIREFTTDSGLKIKVSEKLYYSITKEKKAAALAWVNVNGGGDLMRHTIEVHFAKGEEQAAAEFARECKERDTPLNFRSQQTIAAATLKKFLTDLMKEGEDVPLELFGAFHRKRAEISI